MSIKKLILIGASTGGPGQIQKIVKYIKEDFLGTIIIVQHMQSEYLHSFVKQLNNNCALEVKLSIDTDVLREGKVYILLNNCEIKEQNGELRFSRYQDMLSYSPNINLLFNSASKIKKDIKIMGVILTGIGDDGAKGALELAKSGATCINESKESSIVYGMPKAANELNPSALQLGIDEICAKIEEF